MLTTMVENMGAAISSSFLSKTNQLVFTEYAKGAISVLDLIVPSTGTVKSGTTVIKGTWTFDCETGLLGAASTRIADIWWEQIDSVRRQLTPIGGAGIVNLGQVDFNLVTPAVLQTLSFGSKPIPGNNNATNELKVNDVFAVRTKNGNIAKIRVLQYGYDLKSFGPPLVAIYLLADVGAIAGGWYSSHLLKKGVATGRARKQAMFVCALFALPEPTPRSPPTMCKPGCWPASTSCANSMARGRWSLFPGRRYRRLPTALPAVCHSLRPHRESRCCRPTATAVATLKALLPA